jgi:hypothetical protein
MCREKKSVVGEWFFPMFTKGGKKKFFLDFESLSGVAKSSLPHLQKAKKQQTLDVVRAVWQQERRKA